MSVQGAEQTIPVDVGLRSTPVNKRSQKARLKAPLMRVIPGLLFSFSTTAHTGEFSSVDCERFLHEEIIIYKQNECEQNEWGDNKENNEKRKNVQCNLGRMALKSHVWTFHPSTALESSFSFVCVEKYARGQWYEYEVRFPTRTVAPRNNRRLLKESRTWRNDSEKKFRFCILRLSGRTWSGAHSGMLPAYIAFHILLKQTGWSRLEAESLEFVAVA